MGKLIFVGVECNLLLSTSLQELSNMVSVLCWVTVIDYEVVDDVVVTSEQASSIVVFRDGVGCT